MPLLGALASGRTVTARHARHVAALRRPTAALAHAAAARRTRHVAVRTVARLLLLPAVMMARAETIGPSTRLADGEFRDGARRWRLSFGTRKRRANQGTMDGTFIGRLARLVLTLGRLVLVDRIAFIDRDGLRFDLDVVRDLFVRFEILIQ